MKSMRSGLAALLAGALVAGCGGGIYVEYSDDDDDDDPPSVSLAVSAASAAPGAALRLAAAASDDDFIAEVEFYRVDADGRTTLLGTDTRSAYDWDTTVPSNAARGSTLNFYARAWDSRGQRTDSALVAVTVQ